MQNVCFDVGLRVKFEVKVKRVDGQFQAAAIDAPWGFNPAQLPAPPQRAVQEEQQAQSIDDA
eukprot:5239949-Amphidinium_carterae.2